MRIISLLFVLTGAAAAATSLPDPNNPVYPPCSMPCLLQGMQLTPCEPTDGACLCTDPVLHNYMETCVPTACSVRDQLVVMNVTAIQCHEPPRDKTSVLRDTSLVGGILALLFLVLRFAAKPPTARSTMDHIDDYAMAFTALMVLSMLIFGLKLPEAGFGRDIWTLSFAQIQDALQMMYFHMLNYQLATTGIKVSIVFFYMRVFPRVTMPEFHYILWATVAVVVAHSLAICVAFVCQCLPPESFWTQWDLPLEGRCLNIGLLSLSNPIICLIIDVWVLILPLPYLLKLRLRLKKKIGVCIMFMFGGFVIIVTIPRIYAMNQFFKYGVSNITYRNADVVMITNLETNVAAICACLPRVSMLANKWYRRLFPKSSSSAERSENALQRLSSLPTLNTYHEPPSTSESALSKKDIESSVRELRSEK